MLLATAEVAIRTQDEPSFLGGSIDLPKPAQVENACAMPIAGWVLGRNGVVRAVDVRCGGRVVQQLRLGDPRPDVATYLRGIDGSATSGFSGVVDVSRLGSDLLELRASWSDGSAALGTISIRRFWQPATHPVERGVVSVLVTCSNPDEALVATLAAVDRQTYTPVEVVVVGPRLEHAMVALGVNLPKVRYVESDAVGTLARCNDGIRQSNGEFLTFLQVGQQLSPDIVRQSVLELQIHSECAMVAWETGVIVVRRALFRLIGPFDPERESSTSDSLLRQVTGRFAVLHPRS